MHTDSMLDDVEDLPEVPDIDLESFAQRPLSSPQLGVNGVPDDLLLAGLPGSSFVSRQ